MSALPDKFGDDSTSSITHIIILTLSFFQKQQQQQQHLYDEARLCIKDCDEAGAQDIAMEVECAKNAVDQTFASYVEILEDLRRASEAQLQLYSRARSQNAVNLKALRQELDAIIPQQHQ